MSQFIFVRHGESQANADGVIADAESPLTKLGVEQAHATAADVSGLGITAVACSPYRRARQTAEIIAAELGLPLDQIQVIDDLRERELGELKNQAKAHNGTWYFLDDDSAGIESRTDLLARMTDCLGQIRELAEHETVLVVGHAISGFYLQQLAAGKRSLDTFDSPAQMNNADYIMVHTGEI